MTKKLTKKQNKKIIANDCKKAKKATAVDFKIALKENPDDIKKALKKSRQARLAYADRLFTAENKKTISDIATRLGAGCKSYDVDASFPCKVDLAKLKTIESFKNKKRENTTCRMVAGLLIGYLLRDSESGFGRVFPNGLFLENGVLTDLMTADLIKSESGENEKQRFLFTKKADYILKDKAVASLETALATADLI